MNFAPVTLFVYNRPEHTRRTIAGLKNCPEFSASQVIVFSDGPKREADAPKVEATRAVVRELLPDAELVCAACNRGLAVSVVAGVSRVVAEHGWIIVVEDDLRVAPDFLTFLNAALVAYSDDERVLQVSGFMQDVPPPPTAVFMPFTVSWGWATWRRAWARFDPTCAGVEMLDDPATRRRFDLDGAMRYSDMLGRQLKGLIDSWAILWYWSVFKAGGLVLFPPLSLVVNVGFDGSGTHGTASVRRIGSAYNLTRQGTTISLPPTVQTDTATFEAVKTAARRDYGTSNSFIEKVARVSGQMLSRWIGK